LTVEQTVVIEVCKLAAQFAGALLIAKLAVSWALNRYKSEKTWDRQLAAYVDAVTALSEMRLVVGSWSDELTGALLVSSDSDGIQSDRYKIAKRKLEEGVAAARLLLLSDTANLLAGLSPEIEIAKRGHDQVEDLDRQYDILDRTLNRLIEEGRKTLGRDVLKISSKSA
jgi:hypothetical protein